MRTTGDACPGVLRLHDAEDGAVARVRVPGGQLSRAAVDALADAADAFGDGALDLTARGNVQLRGLARDSAEPLAQVLGAAGLLPSATHELARNLVASPLSGLDTGWRLDVSPLVPIVDEMVCATPELADISGRFLFALDDGRGDVVALEPDLALVADDDGRLALLAASTDTGVRVAPRDAAATLVEAALTFVRVRDEERNGSWRARELSGDGAVLVERLRRSGTASGGPVAVDRFRGGGPVGQLRDANGRGSVVAVVPLGRLTTAQVRAVTSECSAAGVRLTPWRGIVLPHVDDADGAVDRLTRAGLVLDPESAWVGVTACAGTGACTKSLADVRADAAAAVTRGRLGRHTARVHWSGCGRRCGHPAGGALEVVADRDGYRLSADGRTVAFALERGEAIAAVASSRSVSSHRDGGDLR